MREHGLMEVLRREVQISVTLVNLKLIHTFEASL